jgi:HEAT repeat protein
MAAVKRTKTASRMTLTIRSLIAMGVLGAGLTAWSTYTQRRDVEVATGPPSPAQEAFFIDGATRPDIATFFKKLSPSRRLAMAQNIGRYTDPQLAKLCGILLGDFDPKARAALAVSLTHIAQTHPDAAASELSEQGSFQYLGVAQALKATGPQVIPFVAQQLANSGAKSNAESVLVEFKTASVQPVLALLTSKDQATRQAAEETLGKLRATAATGALTAIFQSKAGPDERETALVALAAIGDPTSESTFTAIIQDPSQPAGLRCEAAQGLGRIGSASAAEALWKFAQDPDWDVRDAVMDGLALCGDPALNTQNVPQDLLLTIASRLTSPKSDQVIREALTNPNLTTRAALACTNRPSLTPDLQRLLENPKNQANGDLAEAAIGSLATTPQGQSVLAGLKKDPNLAGFIQRAELQNN